MFSCPRCQRLVDERAPASCPCCAATLTPPSASALNAASALPLPGSEVAGSGTARRNVRVSLTGEALDDTPGSPSPAGSASVSPPVGMSSRMAGTPLPTPQPRPLPASSLRREQAPEDGGSKAWLINLSVAFVLLALCAGGGQWYWTHRTNPKSQVTRYLHAVQWLDWGVVYDLSAPPPGNKSRPAFVSFMDDKFDNNGLYKIAARKSLDKIAFTVGEPAIHGQEAIVPVTRGATAFSGEKSLTLSLTNYGGVWKVHPLGANPLDMMHDPDEDKKAASALLRSLFSDKTGSSGLSGLPPQR